MQFLRKLGQVAGLVIACSSAGHVCAQTSAPARAVNLPAASVAVQPIYPLSEIHAGQRAVTYSVFQGSTPQPTDVDILGVLHNAIGPGKDMILVRLVGARAEYDGVVSGMSGSPVYIDGKLVGAIGFRIGQFTKQPIAGVTPIQQMLDVFKQSAKKSASYENSGSPVEAFDSLARPVSASGGTENPVAGDGVFSKASMLQPIETPLTFDGFSPAAINLFRQRFHSLGLSPVSGIGSASPEQRDPAPVVPGSAISAIIVSGDFNMAATCSVTYVDPKRLLACGHPITQFGDISLPMTKAQVVATIASSLDPMKIVNTTENVGSFTQDRESGVVGTFGKPARVIPVTLAIRGIPQPHTYHFAVAEHPRLTSGALTLSIYQAIQDTNGYNDPATYNLHGEISIDGYPPVRINDMIAPTPQQPSSLTAAISVAQRFDSIFSNTRELPAIHSVSLTLDATPGRQSAAITDARILSPNVRAGDSITVETTMHPYRHSERIVRLTAKLPGTLPPGPARVLVSDGNTLDHTLHLIANPAAPALGLDATIGQLNELHSADRLYVTLLEPVPAASLRGKDLPGVPLTMANVMQAGSNASEFVIDGETALPLVSEKVPFALSGSQILTINVQP
ncbi:MAG TPA: SpoIVB peptidase S55 domain-containing protein [Acidobacteriaceae bacterium]|nr:SpoIVB peptidase S55 domain-containing protein [Acidobacteriaceae bacterium]